MASFRLVAGFLLAPWVPVLAYYAFYAWISSSAGREPAGSALLAGMVPVVYLATILLWLPYVFVLRRVKRERLVPLATGGIVLGAMLGATGLAVGGAAIIDPASANFLMIAAALGLSFGVAFWLIAVVRPAGQAG